MADKHHDSTRQETELEEKQLVVELLLLFLMVHRSLKRIARNTRAKLGLLYLGVFTTVVVTALGFVWFSQMEPVATHYVIPTDDELVLAASEEESAPETAGRWEVYFSAGADGGCADAEAMAPDQAITLALVDKLSSSRESIHIAAFEFNLEPAAQALIDAEARGVEVVFITDDEYGIEEDQFAFPDAPYFDRLRENGVEVLDDARSGLMHNKFIIIDQQAVWTGSTNLTVNGVCRNNNNAVWIEDAGLAAVYEREFAEMRAGEFGPRSPSTIAEQRVNVNENTVDVFFAAEDEVLDHLTPIVSQAAEEIVFMAFSFTADELGGAMLERAADGVNVRGIFEQRGSETEYSYFQRMFDAGLDVRQDGNPGAMHHKVIIIDRRLVITGSFNFSSNANDVNDENLVIIDDGVLAEEYLREFERRWQSAESGE
ncbi:MAG: hypothetical protein JW750_05615 [Anaerolineaceae bacterium]|nr:hypothetical protein [Anaerolineaceae bacterium]